MKVIVLAGGEGKRMWPIQTDKCLIPFLGKPLLYHNLKSLKDNIEAKEFIIIVSPQVKEQAGKIAEDLDLNFQIAVQSNPTGMADAILSAKDLIEGEILVVNAEDILEPKAYQLSGEGDVRVVGFKVDKYFPGGYLKVTGDRVQAVVEKPGEGNEPSDMIKLVVDYFKNGKQLIEYLQKASTDKDDSYEVALDLMIKDRVEVTFTKYEGVWLPLKYPWHILDITAYFLSKLKQQIPPQAKVSEKATIEGNVVIEEGVKVFEGAVIKGPCYIGKNCIVGNNSMIRQSNLEEGCVTGFNCDITRSYIGANSWFHTNYIGDSVLEGDFGMGSGTVLANLRLDNHTIRVGDEKIDTGRDKLGAVAGKGSRVGVNVSTMPGVRIGSGSLVGPGVVLHEDVKDNIKITVKQEYKVSEYTTSLTSYNQFKVKINH
ncbi:NTP transferase domain-containing protein [Candidatus Daviesbacteria bacterium]|nr:NTP transferase domain-containing protein [Candidatus Daviesbacteria bacterium]